MSYRQPSERPDNFQLNLQHPLAGSLAFAGMGGLGFGSSLYYDSSLYRNDGTLTGYSAGTVPTSWSRALGRACLNFDGTGYVDLGYPNSINLSGGYWSILGWVYVSVPVNYAGIFGFNNTGICTESGSAGTWAGEQGGNTLAGSGFGTGLSVGTWVHLAVVQTGTTGGTMSCYTNGIQTFSPQADSGNLTASKNYIGKGYASFKGMLADGIVLNRIASNSLISRLADPSNVMLDTGGSCLLLPPKRRLFASAASGGGQAWTTAINESFGLTDSASRVVSFYRSQLESLGLTDTAARSAGFARSQTEALGATDVVARAAGFARTQADAVGETDLVTRAAGFARSTSESLGATDATSRAAGFARVVSDSSGITDAAVRVVTFARSVTEAEGITDTTSRAAGFVRNTNESVGITDAVNRVATFLRAIAEAEGIADSRSQVTTFARTVSESVGITDTITRAVQFARVLTEHLGATDNLTRAAAYIRTLAEAEGLTDSVSGQLNPAGVLGAVIWYYQQLCN